MSFKIFLQCAFVTAMITGISHVHAGDAKSSGKKDKCESCQKQKESTSEQIMVSKTKKTAEETKNKPKAKKAEAKPETEPVSAQTVQTQVQSLTSGLTDLPPDPKPGECYVRVKQPVKYEVFEEKVLVQEETIRFETIPAKFKDSTQKVLVSPATIRYEVVPAKYEDKMVEVVLLPKHDTFSSSETKFKDEKVKVEIIPERVYWQRGAGPIEKTSQMTEDILCLVRELPKYKDFTKKKIADEAKLSRKEIKAKTQMVATKVLVESAKIKETKVPAKYTTVAIRELVEPATSKKVVVPAKYETVERQRLISPERMVWRRVLCKTNVTTNVVKEIQTALRKKGFNPGNANGQLNPPTCEAIKKYQKKHQLAEGGLTYEVLDHLGVQP